MKRIFLVEDNPDNAELIVDLLSDQYKLSHYVTGPELLEYLEKPDSLAPDMFILDISLPGMDGVTLLKKLRNNNFYKNVPMLALTAHAMKDDKARLLESGFDGYMSKPVVDEDDLINEIERLLNR